MKKTIHYSLFTMNYKDLLARVRLVFQDDKQLRRQLRDIMGFYPIQIEHYKTALTHKSSGQRTDKGRPVNNERLEFLGDAMLDAVVGHIVYDRFPGKHEGFLTNTRSKLVSRESLGRLAEEMGLTRLIHSNAQVRSHNSYMAGNAFEALVGAIYLDQGYGAVMQFMERRILAQMVNIDKVAYKEVNFKSKLIEWTQKNRVQMEYRMLKQATDAKGSPVFGFQVVIEGVEGASAQGYSKKEAQQECSKEMLQRLRREPQLIDAIFQAKSNRTKMEEEPTAVVPDLEKADTSFIIGQPKPAHDEWLKEFSDDDKPSADKPAGTNGKPAKKTAAPAATDEAAAPAAEADEFDEFDLSDISHLKSDQSRESIIAAAEAAAFSKG